MKNRTVELANVVINFENTGLVENLESRVLPAIRGGAVKGRRNSEIKEYRFLDVELGLLDPDETPVMFGRLIKLMRIEAEQEFDESTRQLRHSTNEIASAPSAFFVVNLGTHRMALLGETRRSPGLSNFRHCIDRALFERWDLERQAKLAEILLADGLTEIPYGKKQHYHRLVEEAVPRPDVRVTPLPALEELSRQFAAFEKVISMNIRPMKTNNELPDENEEFLSSLASQETRLGTSTSRVEMRNGKVGLNKDEAANLATAASNGNYKVSVTGKDRNGDDLRTNLDEMSIKLQMEVDEHENDGHRAKRLLGNMSRAFSSGRVRPPNLGQNMIRRARQIVRALIDS